MNYKPRIGLTMDWQESGSFSTRPYLCLREAFFQAIINAGGIPVVVPYFKETLQDYIDMVDGFVLPGGEFASPNEWYIDGDATTPFDYSPRLENDLAIIKHCDNYDVPMLGICAGMQLLGGVMGCKLTDEVHDYYDLTTRHTNDTSRTDLVHHITIEENSLLHQIVGNTQIKANTSHREAIIQVSDRVRVCGKAEDGVIEAIEIPDRRYMLGVQWHPEFFIEKGSPHLALFESLIKECVS